MQLLHGFSLAVPPVSRSSGETSELILTPFPLLPLLCVLKKAVSQEDNKDLHGNVHLEKKAQ